MKRLLITAAVLLLAGCVPIGMTTNSADNSGNWTPTPQQMKAAGALQVGVSTIADVEAVYGQPCVRDVAAHLDTHCFIIGEPGKTPITMLTYMMESDWSPSCFTDPDGCMEVTQSTMLTITYTFDDRGLFKSVSSNSHCTAYVGEYHFDNGCLEHD